MPKNVERFYNSITYLVLFGVIAAMFIYQFMMQSRRPQMRKDGTMTPQSPKVKQEVTVINTIYSVVVVILGNLYKELAWR